MKAVVGFCGVRVSVGVRGSLGPFRAFGTSGPVEVLADLGEPSISVLKKSIFHYGQGGVKPSFSIFKNRIFHCGHGQILWSPSFSGPFEAFEAFWWLLGGGLGSVPGPCYKGFRRGVRLGGLLARAALGPDLGPWLGGPWPGASGGPLTRVASPPRPPGRGPWRPLVWGALGPGGPWPAALGPPLT